MKKILNLTQHSPTPEQVEAGVFESERSAEIRALLTFKEIPTNVGIKQRAAEIAALAAEILEKEEKGEKYAMIGGAPYLMGPLEHALWCRGIFSLYAYSERVSVEETLPDGTVRKTQVFKHLGFVQN